MDILAQTEEGEALTLPGCGFTPLLESYVFDGWNTSPDGTGTDFAVGSVITPDNNLKLYAKWKLSITGTFGVVRVQRRTTGNRTT